MSLAVLLSAFVCTCVPLPACATGSGSQQQGLWRRLPSKEVLAHEATRAAQAAFLALAAGGPPQPRAPCPVPSPFFALLGKAGGTPPRPRALTPEALEALGAADALLSRGDAWAGAGLCLVGGLRSGAECPRLWQGGCRVRVGAWARGAGRGCAGRLRVVPGGRAGAARAVLWRWHA